MRSWLFAAAVAVVALWCFVNPSFAGPMPALEGRDIDQMLAAMKKASAPASDVAAVRYAKEVFGEKTVKVPVGSRPETASVFAQNTALQASEGHLAACAPLNPAQRTAAGALLKEYGAALPEPLHAFTLGETGEPDAAAEAFTTWMHALLPAGACPGEHPSESYRRTQRLQRALECVKRFSPKRDVKGELELIRRSQTCALNNHAVG